MDEPRPQTDSTAVMDRLKIPLPGMVPEKVPTPYTEIPSPFPDVPPRPTAAKETPPDLPPRSSVDNGSNSRSNPFFRSTPLPKHPVPLIPFTRGFSDQFPLHVRVTQGHYGSSNLETLSSQQELVVLCEKRREVLRVRSKSGKTYSIPFGSNVPISLLYNPHDNEARALSGAIFKSLSDLIQLPPDYLPKVLSCCTSDGKLQISRNEILVVNKLDTKMQKLHVQSIPNKDKGKSASEKELDLSCKTQTAFTTKPDSIALYLSDIIKYIHSPCEKSSMALLDLSELSSRDFNNVMLTDPKLSEPVVLVERKTEDSLVVARVEEDGHFEDFEFFEIPLDEKFGIEFTIVDTQNATYSTLEPPSYPSVFNLNKLKLWVTDSCEPSQAIQQIFNSSLRSEHEMEGIDIPQHRYEEIAQKKSLTVPNMPVSIPVSVDPSPSQTPPRPPKRQSHDLPPPIKVAFSPQQSNGTSLSTPPSAVESPAQDFTKTKEFKELLDKALRETLSGPLVERMLSIRSNDTDSPQESK